MGKARRHNRSYRAIPEYYDFEYPDKDMLRHDVPLFLDHLPPRQSVLELAVGTGRAAIPIAQAGHRVTGVDNDARMLAIAQRKRDAVGLSERDLTLLRGDMQKLDLKRRFDWVTVFFNTFLVLTTLEAQDRALQVVRRHLKRRGKLWLDIFQPNLELLSGERSTGLDPVTFYVPPMDRTVSRLTSVKRDVARQVQRVTFDYTWFDSRGGEHHEKTEFDLAFIFPRELRLLLERNGFHLERLYGNYDGSDLNAHSPRMIALCSKRP